MKISELIKELEEFKEYHGDVDIYVENRPDMDHVEPLQVVEWKGLRGFVAAVIELV